MTLNSLVSGGCIISGSVVVQSVLFPRVRINSFCNIDSAVLLPDVWVGAHVVCVAALSTVPASFPKGW